MTLGFMAEVRFLGELRKAAGVATFGIDAGTVEELLEQLGRVMGPAFQEFVFEGGKLQQDVGVLVNGRNIRQHIRTGRSCHRQRAQHAAPDVLDARGYGAKNDLYLSAE